MTRRTVIHVLSRAFYPRHSNVFESSDPSVSILIDCNCVRTAAILADTRVSCLGRCSRVVIESNKHVILYNTEISLVGSCPLHQDLLSHALNCNLVDNFCSVECSKTYRPTTRIGTLFLACFVDCYPLSVGSSSQDPNTMFCYP